MDVFLKKINKLNSDIQKFISCSIDQLSVQYGQNMVFDKANFNFSSGQITAVVGMSGVGKTTLAKSIVDWWRGYDGPTISGHILFYKNNHSKSLSQAYAPQKGLDIAYVPQDATMCFNPLSTVGEQIIEQYVAHKRVPYHEAKEKVIQALILMLSKDAIHVFGAYPYEISGGQA